MIGDTGSGKSNVIRQLLRQVRECGESAIVYDPAMDFVNEFYSPARGDLILNPLDQRCPYWSLGKEIDRDETAATIAAAFLPEKEYEKEFFTDGPRRILAHLLKRQPQPRDILSMMSEPSRIEFAVKGTPLAALLDAGAPAQRAGVLASLNMVTDSLELLPEWEHTRPTFATAEWYTEPEALGVSHVHSRLSREDFAAAFRVARFVHPSHDGLLRRPDGEAGMVCAGRAGEPQ